MHDIVRNRRKNMPNITVVLREEIARLARKEIKTQTEVLRKASAEYRKRIAEMKRQITDLERKVKSLEKQGPKTAQPKTGEDEEGIFRFSARGLRSNRKRLGLSASDYGKLIGVTGQTVYKWEQDSGPGGSSPHGKKRGHCTPGGTGQSRRIVLRPPEEYLKKR